MYKKTNANNKNRNPVIFKPKKMILNGIVYDVDSIETLNRIRSNIETKKKEDFELVEEQKSQKVLIKRTKNKGYNDTVTKFITDGSNPQEDLAIKNRNKQMQLQNKAKLEEMKKKTKLTVISTSTNRKPITKNNIANDDNSQQNETTPNANLLNIAKPDIRPLRKIEMTRLDNTTIMSNDNQIVSNKIIDFNKNYNDYDKPKTLSVISRERKPLHNPFNTNNANDNVNQNDQNSQNNQNGNNYEDKPKTLNVMRREITKIKPLMTKNTMANSILNSLPDNLEENNDKYDDNDNDNDNDEPSGIELKFDFMSDNISTKHNFHQKYDSIQLRLNFAELLLENTKLKISINFGDDQVTNTCNNKIHNFYKVIKSIGGELKHIESTTTNHVFKCMISIGTDTTVNYRLEVIIHSNNDSYGDIDNMEKPENAGLLIMKLLSGLVVKKLTPHIVLPISIFRTSVKAFLNLYSSSELLNCSSDISQYKDFIKRYKESTYFDVATILISEWSNGHTLDKFLNDNHKHLTLLEWQVIFFQVISVLAVIQNQYPEFRHNNMVPNKIFVQKMKKVDDKTLYKYNICNTSYSIPEIGFQIRLSNFSLACIPGIIENKAVQSKFTDLLNIKPEQNRYYDMHFFFNSLIRKQFFQDIMEKMPKIKLFIDTVVPLKFRSGQYVTQTGRLLVNTEYLLPDMVLKIDPLFENFRKL